METTLNQPPSDVKVLQESLLEAQTLLAEKEDENTALQDKLNALIEQLRLARHQRFASSSEKQNPAQGELFDEAEACVEETESDEDDTITVPAHQRKKCGRKPLPAHLPRIKVIHDLNEDEKICEHDGQPLHKIGEEISEQLDIIPAKIQVIRNIRFKYACRTCSEGVKTATMPKQAIPKSNASAGLLAYIATAKYQDALPLYRQENIFKRHDIEIPRATMANWMIKIGGELFTPLINLMRDHLISQPLIHYDETTYQVLKEPDKTAQSKSYMWVGASGPPGKRVILFDYAPTRAASVPVQLLVGFSGYLVTDDYAGYNAVCKTEDITRVGCWAHARRKFYDALKIQKNKTGKAQVTINYIAKLYRIEKQIKELPSNERLQVRQDESAKIIDEMRVWLDKSIPQVPTSSKLGVALRYLNNNWSRLIEFLNDAVIPLDNNLAENAIRPFVIGRKNWLHSNSVKGAYASAAIYSIIETAKANNIEPYGYLKYIIDRLPLVDTVEQFEELLPWNVEKGLLTSWH